MKISKFNNSTSSCELKGFTEDCVCDMGYLKDGDICVRESECGCRTNSGAYYTAGLFVL